MRRMNVDIVYAKHIEINVHLSCVIYIETNNVVVVSNTYKHRLNIKLRRTMKTILCEQ